MEHGARAERRPQSAALPAGILVVDAAVHVLGEEAHWVRYPQIDQLAARERQERLAAIGRSDRHVWPEPQRIVAINPYVIGVVGAPRVGHALELRSRESIERPAFRTELAGYRVRAVERPLALGAVEAREMPTRQHGPDDAVEIKIEPARSVTLVRRHVDFRECGFRRVRP